MTPRSNVTPINPCAAATFSESKSEVAADRSRVQTRLGAFRRCVFRLCGEGQIEIPQSSAHVKPIVLERVDICDCADVP